MKIAHLASFNGNIGDNASHLGLYEILNKRLGFNNYEIDPIEIRRFYKNYTLVDKAKFDESFVTYINQYDLLIIGGGGFLDYWVADSKTGTTIDIDSSTLEKIKTPIFFAGVGSLPHKEVPEGNILKFKHFLDNLLGKENVCIGLRNDGSVNNIHHLFGKEYSSKIYSLADNAFFYKNNDEKSYLTKSSFIVINTTDDQLNMQNEIIGKINKEKYIEEMNKIITYLIKNTDYKIMFVPHIYNDLTAIQYLLKDIHDYYIRTRIIVAPYLSGFDGAKFILSIYKASVLNIGMRFHSNVCSITQGSPTFGLVALDRVIHMYKSIGLTEEEYIRADTISSNEFIKKYEKFLTEQDNVLLKMNDNVEKLITSSLKNFDQIFSNLKIY